MSTMEACVVLRMVDELTAPARQAAAAVSALNASLRKISAVAKTFNASKATRQLDSITRDATSAARSVTSLRTAFARPASGAFGSRALPGLERLRAEARAAGAAVRALRRDLSESAAVRGIPSMRRRGSGNVEDNGRGALWSIAGIYTAQKAAEFARKSLETYRDFDRERRFGAAVMGIDFAQQRALIDQAIKMGGTTRFNDIAVLEGQRELAARGLKPNSILGMMPSAADLASSLGMPLDDAVKQMDAAVFGFKKSIGSIADAAKSARETADAQVKAAKISGMTPNDIAAAYRYGAAPAHMAGVSENTLLAFAGVEKRANISGDQAGTAFRALIAAAEAPTRTAREALLANGLDYSKYQPRLTSIPVDPFVRNVASQYGVALNARAVEAVRKVFSSPALLNDQSKFTPAIVAALQGSLGKQDARALKSIAGMANRFRNSIGGSADVDAFIGDLLMKLPGNLKLANSIFGSKQGSRIATALGDPAVFRQLKEQLARAAGYSEKIAGERMAGFDGAMARLEGSLTNVQTAIGRAFDEGGNGGLLSGITGQMARAAQTFAEASPNVQRLAVEAGAAAAAFAGFKGAKALLDGFGLKGSAIALTEAAAALKAAAGLRGAENAVGAAKSAGDAARKSVSSPGLVPLGSRVATSAFTFGSILLSPPPGEFDEKTRSLNFNGPTPETRFDNWWNRNVPSVGDVFRKIGEAVIPAAHGEVVRQLKSVTLPLAGLAGARKASRGPAQTPFGGLDFSAFTATPSVEPRAPAVPTQASILPKGAFSLAGITNVGAKILAPIQGAASAAVPILAQAGASAGGAFAAGLAAGGTQAQAQMSSLMSSLAAIASKGVEVPVKLDTAAAEAKLSGLMAKAGGGSLAKRSPASMALNDLG